MSLCEYPELTELRRQELEESQLAFARLCIDVRPRNHGEHVAKVFERYCRAKAWAKGRKARIRAAYLEWQKHPTGEVPEMHPGAKGQAKPIRCVETGEVFQTIQHARAWLIRQGISAAPAATSFRESARSGGRAYGYHWKYAEQKEVGDGRA